MKRLNQYVVYPGKAFTLVKCTCACINACVHEGGKYMFRPPMMCTLHFSKGVSEYLPPGTFRYPRAVFSAGSFGQSG